MRLFDFFTEDIAIDLGTANTLIIHNDKVVVDEPSIVATELKTAKVIAVGTKAQQMHGKAHRGIETNRPLKDGVIADQWDIDGLSRVTLHPYLGQLISFLIIVSYVKKLEF